VVVTISKQRKLQPGPRGRGAPVHALLVERKHGAQLVQAQRRVIVRVGEEVGAEPLLLQLRLEHRQDGLALRHQDPHGQLGDVVIGGRPVAGEEGAGGGHDVVTHGLGGAWGVGLGLAVG